MVEKKKVTEKDRIQLQDKRPKGVPAIAAGERNRRITFPFAGTGVSRAHQVCGTFRDTPERTENKQVITELKKSHDHLRHLASHLQSIREEEKTLLAHEIHDDLGQSLAVLKMDLSLIAAKLLKNPGNELAAEKLNSAIGLLSSTIGTIKQISTDLRPPILDHLGIGAAIEWQCEEFQKKSGVQCKVALASDFFTVDIAIAIALFRVFQEALTNVLKHSHATKVEAELKEDNGFIVLEIHDNGVGITEKQMTKNHSFGILEMSERLYPLGGTISISGKKQKGTILTAVIPTVGARQGYAS